MHPLPHHPLIHLHPRIKDSLHSHSLPSSSTTRGGMSGCTGQQALNRIEHRARISSTGNTVIILYCTRLMVKLYGTRTVMVRKLILTRTSITHSPFTLPSICFVFFLFCGTTCRDFHAYNTREREQVKPWRNLFSARTRERFPFHSIEQRREFF